MKITVLVYSQNAYKEYVLPGFVNDEYTIILQRELFQFRQDLKLKFEKIKENWYLGKSDIKIKNWEPSQAYMKLNDKDNYACMSEYGEMFYLNIRIQKEGFRPYKKYILPFGEDITLGSAKENAISYNSDYNGQSFLSSRHAVIRTGTNGGVLEDCSSNGTFLNNKRVYGRTTLFYGDHINAWGLDIIYLGEILAVGPENAVVNLKAAGTIENYRVNQNGENEWKNDEIFHRAPRTIEKLDTEEVEIEAPPAAREEDKMPLWMQIGPAFTMTLPMLLGSGMALVSNRMLGMSGTSFMYTGLVTAGCSGALGVFWAFNNIRYSEKQRKKEEEHRLGSYSRYLSNRISNIKSKYEYNTIVLNKRYPAAEEMLMSEGENLGKLWERNSGHQDFLYHRLGVGDIPFQASILVPKEKFTLIDDSLAEKPKQIKDEYRILHNVPIGIDLKENHLIGIIGTDETDGRYQVAKNLIAQISARDCYTDVKFAFFCKKTDETSDQKWRFASWLPHTWSENRKFRYMAYGQNEASDVSYEITKILRRRAESRQAGLGTATAENNIPHYVIVIEDLSLIEGELLEKYVLNNTADLGMTAIILAGNFEELPNTCNCIIENDHSFSGICMITNEGAVRTPVRFDSLNEEKLEKFARRISRMRVKETEQSGEIPDSITFFDMYGIKKLEELKVEERWRKNHVYESMKALIGLKAGNQPCYLDLHEKYHGPHGLVAGTTGSGKSETLQTYILSLAINFSPEDVGLFIIDYKGGGMGNLFAKLPHVLGRISNLSGNQIHRAMVSIKSENVRRQKLFNESGVNNINAYTTLYKHGEVKEPIPHLFIVIDEFAELKREEPDFMRELISVAQVGRSLGVHLILATQKPAGTVDDNIWSNSRFHLCLRVQDRQDSMDMLHKPDAAYVVGAGRGYLQVGNDEVYELFQSGWSGAAYEEDEENGNHTSVRMLTTTGQTALIGNYAKSRKLEEEKIEWIESLLKTLELVQRENSDVDPTTLIEIWNKEINREEVQLPENEYNRRLLGNLAQLKAEGLEEHFETLRDMSRWVLSRAEKTKTKIPEKKDKSQLDAVVQYLGQAAKTAHIPKLQPLWLPPLGKKLYLSLTENIQAEWEKNRKGFDLCVEAGLCDDPENQMQTPLVLNFMEDGHHVVCGSPSSGKSTFLQTVVYSLLEKYDPASVNLYILDFSSKMLEIFENTPHVGGILYENDINTVGKLFHMLDRDLQFRKKLYRGSNYSQYTQKNGRSYPAIVLVIDNYAAFREKTEGRYDDFMLNLSRIGAANGIYLLLSAASYGTQEIPNRIRDNIRRTICLEQPDKYQYMEVLGTTRIDVLPDEGIKGRGLVKLGDSALEFQTYLALDARDDYERLEKLKAKCEEMASYWKNSKARPIPRIPEKPIWSEFEMLPEVQKRLADNEYLPIGYETETADIYSIDLKNTYCYMISGKSKTGKTNLQRVMMRGAKAKKAHICTIELNGNELTGDTEKLGGTYIDSCEKFYQWIVKLLPVIQERNKKKKELQRNFHEKADVFDKMVPEEPYFVYIAEFSSFIKMLRSKEGMEKNLENAMANIWEKGELLNLYFITAFNWDKRMDVYDSAAFKVFCNHDTGLHLGGNAEDQRLLTFPGISIRELSKTENPGVGLTASSDGRNSWKIITPLVKGE